MEMKKAFGFQLKPNLAQDQNLQEFAGHSQFLWNKALSLNLQRLKQKQPILYYPELDFWTKLAIRGIWFLSGLNQSILEQGCYEFR